nr:hypothetical protein GCM10025699_52770 [Microbacterium flavescens]
MATTNDIKNGAVLNLDGQLWNVIEFQHVKPGKGGAFVRTKMKNVMSGKVVDKTFNAGTKIDFANVDRREYTYLYAEADGYVFMDTSDYDQINVPATVVGDAKNFMLENQNVQMALHDGTPLYIELPASVILEVTYTEPGLQGDRSTGGTKPATVETGYEIQVPLFLENGTKVKVDTRDGSYLGRVSWSGSSTAVSARTKARKRALDVLYVADIREISMTDALVMETTRAMAQPERNSSWGYARDIVQGVIDHRSEIDELIETYSQGWSLNRMPTLDRAILRIGIWELGHNDEIPDHVAISEAVELAQSLSTDDSATFVNGLLGRIAASS